MSQSTGLIIGIPTLGRPLTLDWAFAFKSMNPPINYNTVFSVVRQKAVADARNLIVEEAIRQNAKYLFFMGDDTTPPPNTLKQLIFRMEQDPTIGIVGGVYCSKSDPPAPLVFRGDGAGSYWDWKIGEFFECTGLGMDCTLIRIDLFKELQRPWFVTEDSDRFADGINNASQCTEDLYFCNRVLTETSFKVWCDASIQAFHEDVYTGRRYTLPSYSLPTRRLEHPNGNKKIVDLGCGPLIREFEEGVPVRVDINEDCNPDYRCDVRSLPFGNDEFDIVFSSHVLEHFSRKDQYVAIIEWLRILKNGGELRLILPNLEWAAQRLLQDDWKVDEVHIWNVFYGAQVNQWDFHYNGFTPSSLRNFLAVFKTSITSIRLEGYNMIVSAEKQWDGDTKI